MSNDALIQHALPDGCHFYVGRLPARLVWDDETFGHIWALHPAQRHVVKIRGKLIPTPRWQQSFGANYAYSGSVNNAQPVPPSLRPMLEFVQQTIDPRLNGLLLNWYEGPKDHIGPHHDASKDLVPGSPIITTSFGEVRTFRLTQGQGAEKRTRDFLAAHGALFVMPWETNLAWKHAVPKRTSYAGRRISVTFRAFSKGLLPPEEYFAPAVNVVPKTAAD